MGLISEQPSILKIRITLQFIELFFIYSFGSRSQLEDINCVWSSQIMVVMNTLIMIYTSTGLVDRQHQRQYQNQ